MACGCLSVAVVKDEDTAAVKLADEVQARVDNRSSLRQRCQLFREGKAEPGPIAGARKDDGDDVSGHGMNHTSRLLVLLPTRSRRELALKCAKSFTDTAAGAEMLVITDLDDRSYDGACWPESVKECAIPRLSLSGKLNQIAREQAPRYDAVMFTGDDHVFQTPRWDSTMMGKLAEMGGSGILYPDDKRRTDLPEIWLVSSDIIMALGYFAEPSCRHYYLDNIWADIGRHTGLLRFCPEVVIQHCHYSVHPEALRDSLYRETEESHGSADAQAYQIWRHNKMDEDVATVKGLLRKRKNPEAGLCTHVKGS